MVRELTRRCETFLCIVDWFRLVDAGIFDEVGDHAGEMETSLMQFLAPELVLPLSQAGPGRERKFRIRALREGRAWSQRDWTKAAPDTGVGDPGPATPEKGERCFSLLTAEIAGFLVDLAAADTGDLYE